MIVNLKVWDDCVDINWYPMISMNISQTRSFKIDKKLKSIWQIHKGNALCVDMRLSMSYLMIILLMKLMCSL